MQSITGTRAMCDKAGDVLGLARGSTAQIDLEGILIIDCYQ